jgi:WD40 repeat protein
MLQTYLTVTSPLIFQINDCVFSPDSKFLLASTKTAIWMWEVETGILVKKIEDSYTKIIKNKRKLCYKKNLNFVFSSDGKTLATCRKIAHVILWSFPAMECIDSVYVGKKVLVFSVFDVYGIIGNYLWVLARWQIYICDDHKA